MPVCLDCGTELEYDATYDQESDAEEIICYELGHCPKCKKAYKWKDIFKFETFEDLERK